MIQHYIAYLDLLGIKSIATYDYKKYYDYINKFQANIKDCADNFLEEDDKLYVFSDCAYIESKNIEKLINFLQRLRKNLIVSNVFFNAAITQGVLSYNSVQTVVHNDKMQKSYTIFNSENTVKVFSLQSMFSGIGIYIDPVLKDDDKLNKEYLIESCYCKYSNNGSFENFIGFYDIKYGEISKNFSIQNIAGALFKNILYNFLQTLILDRRAARYYFSAMRTLITQLSIQEIDDIIIPILCKMLDNSIENNIMLKDLLPCHLMIIDRIYSFYDDEDNYIYELKKSLTPIIQHSILKFGMIDLHNYSNFLISDKNKYKLSRFLVRGHFDL